MADRPGPWLLQSERQREDLIRIYICPTCGADVGRPCVIDGKKSYVSHTRRYEVGAADGIVPALAGARHA